MDGICENAEIRPTKGAPVAERRQHLQNTIAVLARYPHFQLALLDDGEAAELRVTRETNGRSWASSVSSSTRARSIATISQ